MCQGESIDVLRNQMQKKKNTDDIEQKKKMIRLRIFPDVVS